MKDNKLIAEFMGRGGTFNHDKTMICTGSYPDTMTLMKYHTSWDWLMPVLTKCMQTGGDTDKWDHLYNVLSELNIDELYKAVVEFIKDHNLKQDKPLKLSGEMIDVGLLSVEEETIFFWDDFNNSRKKK